MHRTDKQLAARMAAGDESAFEAFFERHFTGLFRFALPRVEFDADVAEDVAQATLCKAIDKISSYRGDAALFTWLCTFCRHEIAAVRKRRGREPRPVGLPGDASDLGWALELVADTERDDPEAAARRSELVSRIRDVLDELSEHHASALRWKYIEGASVQTIAGRLELGYKAAESVLTRARKAFRDRFESHYAERSSAARAAGGSRGRANDDA